MNYFNYQRYLTVTDALTSLASNGDEEAPNDLKYIEQFMNSCYEYVRAVDEMETAIRIARFHLEPEEYKEKVEQLDQSRRAVHNGIIADLNMLEKLLACYGLPHFFDGSTEDRYQVADFCGEVSNTIFKNRK